MSTYKKIINYMKKKSTRKKDISKISNIFDGSIFSSEFKNMCDMLSNDANYDTITAAKPVFIQIAVSFFDDFKPENAKLLSSIQSNVRRGLTNIYDIIPVDKVNNFHIVDLYIALFICGSAFENESLISLITIMVNDKEITKQVIKEATQKCLHGYLPSSIAYRGGISKEKLFHIISLLIIVSNTIWITLNWYHYTVSTSNLFNAIQNGKVSELGDVTRDMFNFVKEMETCKQNSRKVSLKKSYTRAAAGLLLNEDSKKMLNSIENAFVCFQSPEIMKDIAEELTFMEAPLEDEEKIIEIEDDSVVMKEEPKIINKNDKLITSNTLIAKSYVREKYLLNDITKEDMQLVGISELRHINEEASKLIAILKPTKKITYKQARAELLSLVEDEDITRLAKKLLSNEGFVKFMEESYLREETQKSLDKKIHINNVPGLMESASIILGATYEFFMTSPSHTPFYDIIWNIKQKIILFEREIESKILKYRNLFTDVNTEIERFNQQFNSTWERSAKICSDIFLLFSKIIGYYVVGQQIRKYKKRRFLSIKDVGQLAIKDKSPESSSESKSNQLETSEKSVVENDVLSEYGVSDVKPSNKTARTTVKNKNSIDRFSEVKMNIKNKRK